jgi:hypothetical protein
MTDKRAENIRVAADLLFEVGEDDLAWAVWMLLDGDAPPRYRQAIAEILEVATKARSVHADLMTARMETLAAEALVFGGVRTRAPQPPRLAYWRPLEEVE